MNEKKVLLVSGGNIVRGGIEMFLLNWVKYAPKENYRFVWYAPGIVKDPTLVAEFETLGVEVISGNISDDRNTFYRIITLKKDISGVIKSKGIDIVHVNTGVLPIQTTILPIAKKYGVRQRIAHSHNAPPERRGLKHLVKSALRRIIFANATDFAACSRQAARYLLGNKHLNDAVIINNCIDTKKFAFSQEARMQSRRCLGIADNFVLGHVGRFTSEKNHALIIDVFSRILERDSDARLLLLGSGALEENIKKKVLNYGFEDKVIFTGVTNEVHKYLCAMDVFLLPSTHEGFPIVGIEAQTSGLPCVFSDMITTEIELTDNCRFVSLSASLEKWADTILEHKCIHFNRENAWSKVCDRLYDVSHIRHMVEVFYGG